MKYNVIKTGTQGQRLRASFDGRYIYTSGVGYDFERDVADKLAMLYNGYVVEAHL